jgi:hypothetical protein
MTADDSRRRKIIGKLFDRIDAKAASDGEWEGGAAFAGLGFDPSDAFAGGRTMKPFCQICGDNRTLKELIDYDPCLLQTDITANYANYANRKRTNDRRFPLADFLSRSSRFSLSGLAYACNATAA